MANQITEGPNEYDFGYEFDYSLWTAGTQIDLVNVPWNNDYRDVVKFANKAALNTYIDSLSPSGTRIENLSYVKPNTPIRADIPHTRALRYNYLRASNPLQPVPNDQQKDFYYFILDARYVAPNTTELILQLDVWQTFGYDITLGNCYIERGHIGIANSNAFNNFGRDYLTVPEGLDIGGDYVIRNELVEYRDDPVNTAIIAVSTVDLITSGGTTTNPILESAPGSNILGIPSGASYYGWKNSVYFNNWLDSKREQPWVTQGIMAIMIVPAFKSFFPDVTLAITPTPSLINVSGSFGTNKKTTSIENPGNGSAWRTKLSHIPSKYAHLDKFKVSPYLILELTTYSGNPIIIRPENWNTTSADIVEQMSFLLPNAKHVIYPKNYNGQTLNSDGGEKHDFATGFPEFVKTAVVNNMAINFLATNTNSLAWQRQSADWSQQRAMAGASAGYDIATGAINTATDLANYSISADAAQTALTNRTQALQSGINALGSTAAGGLGGAVFGPGPAMAGALAGAAQGVAGTAQMLVQTHANSEAQNIRALQTTRSTTRQNEQTALIRDTNKGLADWSAKGDYANTIAGINAKVQDAQMIQPTASGQAGGAQFNFISGLWNIYLRIKSIDNAAIDRIGDFWLRYGYAVQRFIVPPQSLKVMEKFSYWKMQETYISASNVPEGMKQAYRGILEKGTTVWSNPTDIGTIDISNNAPLTGISY